MDIEEENYKGDIVFGDIFDGDDGEESWEEGAELALKEVESKRESIPKCELDFKTFIHDNFYGCDLAEFRVPLSLNKIKRCADHELTDHLSSEESFWRELVREEGIALRSEEFFFTKLSFLLNSCR